MGVRNNLRATKSTESQALAFPRGFRWPNAHLSTDGARSQDRELLKTDNKDGHVLCAASWCATRIALKHVHARKIFKREESQVVSQQPSFPFSPLFVTSCFTMFSVAALTLFAFAFASVRGESHTITFTNKCALFPLGLDSSIFKLSRLSGAALELSPTLIQNGNVLSTGGAYTTNGPISAAIAYLQTGSCGFNGEDCTLLEVTLQNPTSPGSGSSVDLSLIPPHAFSVTSGFGYYNGCDGTGADCSSADCPTAFHSSGDTTVQVACQDDNVDLAITFCD
uniref:Glycopeptide n=1 Tax=Mycena chlorophos TaxID=658473 RepID=A0ABQ0LPP8_MYCCL|nr:predicted protein [Mycena chlorophos]